jgi:hypothetical protein
MICEQCGKQLPPGTRRSRRFCDETCRSRFRRAEGAATLVGVAAVVRSELSERPAADVDADISLARLRDALWDSFDAETGTAKANLGRELRLVLAELESRRSAAAAASPPKPTFIDHLVARREARLAHRPMPPCPPGLNCDHEGQAGPGEMAR